MNEAISICMDTVNSMKEILDDELEDIFIEFKEEIPLYIDQLTTYLDQNNIQELMELSHSVKSSSGNLGFLKLSEICRIIEESLRKDHSANVESEVSNCITELKYLTEQIDVICKQL